MARLSYVDVQNIIIKYIPDMSPVFADRFERFPREENATEIINRLEKQAEFYKNIDISVYRELNDAKIEMLVRIGQ